MGAWQSSSHPTSARTSPASRCCAASRSSSSAATGMTLSGRNGAGKTTLLRMLSGEASIDGGELVLAKGTRDRAARPAPAARPRPDAARLRALAARRELLALEARAAARSSRRWRAAPTTRRRSTATPSAQARLEHAGGYSWRERALRDAPRPRLPRRRRPRPLAGDVLRRRADARLARRGRSPATPTCCCSTSRPTTSTSSRSSGSSSTCVALDAAVVLVAHDRWFLEAVGTAVLELEAGRGALLRRHLARVAQGEGRARARARPRDRAPAGRDRAARAVRRRASAPGTRARQAQSRAKKLDKIERHRARPARRRARSRSRSSRPSAAAASCSSSRTAGCRGRRPGAARRRRAVARARRARLAGRPQRRRQDDADRDARRAQRRSSTRGKLRTGHNVKLGFLSQHAEELDAGTARTVLEAAPARHRADPDQGARAARAVPVLRRGRREAARRPLRRRAPAAVAGDPRRSPAPTC